MLGENKSRRALIIVNMTDNFAHQNGANYIAASKEIIPFVQGELQYFRDRMRPVVFCNSAKNSAIIRELSPRRGEICIEKDKYNAFLNTNLDHILQEQKVENLTIVGLQLHSSILLTAAAALAQGFSVVVPETCVCSDHEQEHLAALRLFNLWSKAINI